MVREITVTETGSWTFDGDVVARSTPATQRLLEPILENTRVRASSTYQGEPSVGPSWPSTATRPASGRPRPATRARRSGCAGRIDAR